MRSIPSHKSSLVRKLTVVAIAGGLSAGALPAAHSSPDLPVPSVAGTQIADSLSEFEQTNPTPEQQAEMEELRQLLADEGMETSGISVYVVPEADGPTTYVTRSPGRFEVRPAGDVYQVVPTAGARPPSLDVQVPVSQPVPAGANWVVNNEDCFRVSMEYFGRWVCWQVDEQSGDRDPGRHFWQYTQRASGSADNAWKMKRLWVEGKPHARSARMRFDGMPAPGESSRKMDSCDSVSEGISVSSGSPVTVGFSRTWSRVSCERYEVKDYDDHGHWATIWEGKPLNEHHTRQVIFTMPVSTVAGQIPLWDAWSGQERD